MQFSRKLARMSLNSPNTTTHTQTHALGLEAAKLRQVLQNIVECSPWVIDRAVIMPPYENDVELWHAIIQPIEQASYPEQMALLCAHPELAGTQAMAGTMTVDSTSEQARLGLLSLKPSELQRLNDLNRRYQQRFGFPFIVALRLFEDLSSLLDFGEQRLSNDPGIEVQVALGQVYEVIRGRLHLRLSLYNPSNAEPAHSLAALGHPRT